MHVVDNSNEIGKDQNPTYLGMQLDRQLALKNHAENLNQKPSNASSWSKSTNTKITHFWCECALKANILSFSFLYFTLLFPFTIFFNLFPKSNFTFFQIRLYFTSFCYFRLDATLLYINLTQIPDLTLLYFTTSSTLFHFTTLQYFLSDFILLELASNYFIFKLH